MPAIINSDDGVVSGSSGLKTSGANDGITVFQQNGTESMRIDSSGNITVKDKIQFGIDAQTHIQAGGTSDVDLIVAGDTNIRFETATNERMRIDSSGNVGIGTSSPTDTNGFGRVLDIQSSTGAALYVRDSDSPTTLHAYFGFLGSSSTIYVWNKANGPILFGTNDAERARIDSSGNLLVGTTSSGNPNPGIKMAPGFNAQIVVGHDSSSGSGQYYMPFYWNGSLIGGITQNGTTAVAYNTTSDYRLKENVQPMTGALARVAALRPVTYTWKAAPEEIGEGFIAHELAQVCQQAVTGEKDAVDADGNPVYQGIDTSFLVATLTAAIQELKAELDATKAEVAALKAAAVNGQPASP